MLYVNYIAVKMNGEKKKKENVIPINRLQGGLWSGLQGVG